MTQAQSVSKILVNSQFTLPTLPAKSQRIFTTEPFYSPRPWGYELWMLSTHRNGQSLVLPGEENLLEYLGHSLPILIKIIQANEALSVQVHPDDAYARVHENDHGKTECWYILEADENASLIVGLAEGLDRESLARSMEEGTLEDNLRSIPVAAGDMIFIPSGTVHAILGGIKLLEIQQSSDATYRMYDWGRDREMHIEKALDVIDYQDDQGAGRIQNFTELRTPYFHVEKIVLDHGMQAFEASESFNTINVCHGEGMIMTPWQMLPLVPDQTIYIPQGVEYTIAGSVEVLRTAQPA